MLLITYIFYAQHIILVIITRYTYERYYCIIQNKKKKTYL